MTKCELLVLKNLYGNYFFILLAVGFCFGLFKLEAYEVRFEGISDPEASKLVESVSQLNKLKDAPPSTLLGLKRRAEGDLPTIVQALHSLAYYNARVDFHIENQGQLVIVRVLLDSVYPLADFQIHFKQNGEAWQNQESCSISLEDLKVKLGEPALPETIINAEDNLLDHLNLNGYAFASIKKRDVLVDQQKKQVTVMIDVDVGPLTYFGPLRVSGLERVKKSFFYKKLKWCEGDLYDPKKVEKTQEALELSGLFRAVNITHDEHPHSDHYLPMSIEVMEGKQRSIGFGLNYTTVLGPGISAEWEDRNIFGEGQRLSIRTDVWRELQEANVTYLIPDFQRQNQNLIWALDYNHEKIRAFTDTTFSVSGIIERQLSSQLRVSYGGMYKFIQSERSDLNGMFDLIKIPLQMRWTNTDNLLDPTEGVTFTARIVPSIQIFSPRFAYIVNNFTATYYQSLTANKKHIFAAKLMFGTILGASKRDIPPPERFLAGSETTLRGYKYLTVSPLGRDHKPLGGRSLLIYSLELRNRIGKNWGWVAFYEIGNVFYDSYPNLDEGLLQSVGAGVTYHTPVGPVRFDVAIPLNRRAHLDPPFQIYFSIGQTF